MLAVTAPILLAAQLIQATLVGTVRDSETGHPLWAASVALTDLDRGASTDSSGRYSFTQVPPGPHHIVVRMMGYAPRSLHALVPREGELTIDVALRAEPVRLGAVDVQAHVSIRGVESGSTTQFPDRELSTAAVANHPLLAEPDVLHAFGGGEVVVRQETPGGVYIRGGASDQTGYLLDGVPVFNPYHSAGVSSAWNPDALSRLYLSSAEPSSASPHALSGTIEAATRRPGDRLDVRGGVSTTQARLTADGPIGGAGGGYVLSARSGLHDLIAPEGDASYLNGQTADWLAKIQAPLAGGRAQLLSYGNANEVDAAASEPTGGVAPRNAFEWHSRSFGVDWRRKLAGLEWRVLGWGAAGDAMADWFAPSGTVNMNAKRRDEGLLVVAERRSERASSVAAMRVDGSRTSYRTVLEPDSAATQSWRLESRSPAFTLLGRHARRIGARVEGDAGLSLALVQNDLYPGPRALLRWTASERLVLSGSYVRTHQFAQSLRNPESVVGHIFPIDIYAGAGAQGIPTARSNQGVLAADYRPTAGVRLGLQGYERSSSGLVLVAPRDGGPFTIGGFAVGRGRARGISVEAAASSARYGAIASYAWQRVRYEYGDSSYTPEHAAEHLLEGGLIVFPTATTSVRLAASAAFGRRTTAVPGSLEWEACNLLDQGCEFTGSPYYGGEPLGATRLPPYFRLDVGIRQHWHITVGGRDASMGVFGTVTNILGRTNLLTYARDPMTGERVGIGLRPSGPLVVGLDWRF